MIHLNKLLDNGKYGFLRRCQFSFIGRKPALTQLLTCFNLSTRAIDQQELFKVVYIDFERASDKSSHVKLVQGFKGFGISGSLLA